MTVAPGLVVETETRPAGKTLGRGAAVKFDSLDVHLLRELLQGPATTPLNPDFRRSFRSVARTLRVDEDTARNRARRLKDCGFIQGWSTMLNPNLLGLHQTGISICVPPTVSKTELVTRLKLVPDVFLIVDTYGRNLHLILAHDSPHSLRIKTDLIRSLAGVPQLNFYDVMWPECKIDMSATDWRILKSLQRDPGRSYASIAKEVGASTRTIERRLRRMTSAGVLFAMHSLNPKALDGTVLASLAFFHPAQKRLDVVQKVMHELDDYLWHMFFAKPTDTTGTFYAWFSLALPSIAKARAVLDWAERQEDIRDPRVELWEDHIVLLETLDHWLDSKLQSLGIA